MPFTQIAALPQIQNEIVAFYGPGLSAVIILTLSVQILRDHENRVHELWACGCAASRWEGERYAAEVQEEINQLERDRYESIPCEFSLDSLAFSEASDREHAAPPELSHPEAGESRTVRNHHT